MGDSEPTSPAGSLEPTEIFPESAEEDHAADAEDEGIEDEELRRALRASLYPEPEEDAPAAGSAGASSSMGGDGSAAKGKAKKKKNKANPKERARQKRKAEAIEAKRVLPSNFETASHSHLELQRDLISDLNALHNTLIELQTACKWYTENAPGWVRKKAPFPFPHFPSSPSVWYSAKTQKDARSIMSGLIAEVHGASNLAKRGYELCVYYHKMFVEHNRHGDENPFLSWVRPPAERPMDNADAAASSGSPAAAAGSTGSSAGGSGLAGSTAKAAPGPRPRRG
ncbi:unnamed protein product [Symbiodinium necroappetens]|uniref:Uncharacterized protein n=1 Tax=Symbiodinium necroappetens TaxID=1628268 RepID=A0A813A640_9DINO|nr:unnamed protein product [Symbiodinium necroappetens]